MVLTVCISSFLTRALISSTASLFLFKNCFQPFWLLLSTTMSTDVNPSTDVSNSSCRSMWRHSIMLWALKCDSFRKVRQWCLPSAHPLYRNGQSLVLRSRPVTRPLLASFYMEDSPIWPGRQCQTLMLTANIQAANITLDRWSVWGKVITLSSYRLLQSYLSMTTCLLDF